MNNAARASALSALLLSFAMAAAAQPASLPGQSPGGHLPGAAPKPASAAPPSAGAALPNSPCCAITAINKATGIVTAREKIGANRTIDIKATPAQIQNLHVGQDIFANLETKKASLDGKTLCCDIAFAAAASTPAAASTLSASPPQPMPQPPKSAPASPAKSMAGTTLTKQDPETSVFVPRPTKTFSCPTALNAPAPAGWQVVPPTPAYMQFPLNIMLLVRFDGAPAPLDSVHISASLAQTKYINCYYRGNSGSGNPLTDYPTNADNTPKIYMTLPKVGDPDRYWTCKVVYMSNAPLATSDAICSQN